MNHSPQGSSQESSVLYSLNELLEIESERVADEAFAIQQERRRRKRESEERMEVRRREEFARIEHEEEERRRECQRRREETARLVAVKDAELERVRQEVGAQERLQFLLQSNEHEERMQSVSMDETKKRLRRWLLVAFLLSVVLSVAGAFVFEKLKADAKKVQTEFDGRSQELEQKTEKIRREYAEELERLGSLDRERRTELEEKLKALRPGPTARPPVKPGLRSTSIPGELSARPGREEASENACPEGDPLCSEF